MNITLEQDAMAHHNNTPKLQWLILLIPAFGAFVAYSLIRMHKKRRKVQQLLRDQEPQHLPTHHPITAPSPAFFWQRLQLVEQDQQERRRQRRSTRLQGQQQHDTRPPPPAYSPSSSSLPKYDDITTEPTQTHIE